MSPGSPGLGRAVGPGLGRAAGTYHGVVLRRLQQGQGQLREGERREASGTAGNRDTDHNTRNTPPRRRRGVSQTLPAAPDTPGRQAGAPRPGPAAHHRAGAATAPGAAAQTAPGPARGQSERGAAPAEPIRARTHRCGRKANALSAPFTTAPQTEERDGKQGHALASRRSQRPVPVPRI